MFKQKIYLSFFTLVILVRLVSIEESPPLHNVIYTQIPLELYHKTKTDNGNFTWNGIRPQFQKLF